MAHTRHRHFATMRRYVRRLSKGEATAQLDL